MKNLNQIKMNVVKRIIKARNEKGFTQSEMAEKLNISQQGYNRIETKNKDIGINQLEAIAKALDVDIKALLFDEKESDCEKENEALRKEISYLKEIKETLHQNLNFYKKTTYDYEVLGNTPALNESEAETEYLRKEVRFLSGLIKDLYGEISTKTLANTKPAKLKSIESVLESLLESIKARY